RSLRTRAPVRSGATQRRASARSRDWDRPGSQVRARRRRRQQGDVSRSEARAPDVERARRRGRLATGRTDRGERLATRASRQSRHAAARGRSLAGRSPRCRQTCIGLGRFMSPNLSKVFIDRPIFAGVLSTFIFILGVLALFTLPVSEYPDVVPPSRVVRAVYPGANPAVIATAVAAPLEEQINGVENMLYMSSQATTDGVLTLTVTFKIGTDVDLAETQVQNRVQRALPRMPEEVRQIGITTEKSSPNLTMVVHLLSPDERYDELYLRNYAVLNVKDVLQRIPNINQTIIFN